MSKILKFDALIIGSGFDALYTAFKLQSQGQSVAVLEETDAIGGLYRSLKDGDALLESHVNFVPATPVDQNMLMAIKNDVPELELDVLDLGPLTFHNGHVQPFLGFGETEIQAVDEYASFLSNSQIELNMGLGELARKLRALLTCQVLTQSEVTALELEPELAVTVNGSQKITATTLYFFESPHKLSELLTGTNHHLTKSVVQRLSKIPLWTAVNLAFRHPQSLTESSAVHVLYGAKDQPCIGRFRQEDAPTPVYSSQWTTFVSQEVAADSELLGATIREMKKQIKRMYPNFFEQVSKEFIVISPDAYGSLPAGFTENGHLPKNPQIKVGSRFYAAVPGLGGDLQALATVLGAETVPEPAIEVHLT